MKFRKLRSVDRDCFLQQIKDSTLLNHDTFGNVSELACCYDTTLSSLLDRHAPFVTKTVTLGPAAPWYSEEIAREKTERRRLERLWCSTQLTVNRQLYVEQCIRVNNLIYDSKMTFYADIIENNSNNQRVLFSSIGKMLNLHATEKLPSYDSARDLAEVFVDFFSDKVQARLNSFPSTVISYKVTLFYRAQ